MTNSSWTQGHVNTLLGIQTDPTPGSRSIRLVDNCPRGPWTMKVYPPCDTTSLSALPLQGRDDRMILSVAQFRPEKEHATQLRVLRAYYDANPRASLLLTMAGSVRNKGDEERLAGLKELAKDLGLSVSCTRVRRCEKVSASRPREDGRANSKRQEEQQLTTSLPLGSPPSHHSRSTRLHQSKVNFVVNPSWPELVALFGRASIGLSTMVDEHFGINVVEFMVSLACVGDPTDCCCTRNSDAIGSGMVRGNLRGCVLHRLTLFRTSLAHCLAPRPPASSPSYTRRAVHY